MHIFAKHKCVYRDGPSAATSWQRLQIFQRNYYYEYLGYILPSCLLVSVKKNYVPNFV